MAGTHMSARVSLSGNSHPAAFDRPVLPRRHFNRYAVAVLIAPALVRPAIAALVDDPQLHGERIALVIGNASYARMPLQNPVRDSRLIATALGDLGFQVRHLENAKLADMLEAMRLFLLQASGSQVRVVYFAGHGTQFKGKNYLVPVDIDLRGEAEIAGVVGGLLHQFPRACGFGRHQARLRN